MAAASLGGLAPRRDAEETGHRALSLHDVSWTELLHVMFALVGVVLDQDPDGFRNMAGDHQGNGDEQDRLLTHLPALLGCGELLPAFQGPGGRHASRQPWHHVEQPEQDHGAYGGLPALGTAQPVEVLAHGAIDVP